MDLRWYVLWAKPGCEAQVASQLKVQRIEVFSPRIKSLKTPWTGRLEPLFPCYVFGRLDINSAQILIARSSPGVRGILGVGGIPTPISNEIVQVISERVDRVNHPSSRREFQHGERVLIGMGPFKDLEAVFDRRLSASGRARVFINLIGRSWSVQVDSAHLSKDIR